MDAAPRSHGALPVATAGGEALVPLPDGEALWLGLVPRSRRVAVVAAVVAEGAPGARIDAATGVRVPPGEAPRTGFVVPPTVAVDGLPRPGGGAWCLTRAPAAGGGLACAALEVTVLPARRVLPAARRAERPPRAAGNAPERAPAGPALAALDGGEWREDRRVVVRARLVSPAEFTARTGLAPPAPLDPRAAYRGWRLP